MGEEATGEGGERTNRGYFKRHVDVGIKVRGYADGRGRDTPKSVENQKGEAKRREMIETKQGR